MNNFHNNINRSIALGIFDGVHLGHREVINAAVNAALPTESGALTPCVFMLTELSHKKQDSEFIRLISDEYKAEVLRILGVKDIVTEKFDDIRNLSLE